MIRKLTFLSATICFVAATRIALSGPGVDAPENAPVDSRSAGLIDRGTSDAFLSTTDLLKSLHTTGFAASELEQAHPRDPYNELTFGSIETPTMRLTLDVSDFISPNWQVSDAGVEQFSQPVASGEMLPYSRFALATSTDVNTLSVPEIPLPLGVIPGVIGVGLAAWAHRRSLKHRNKSK